jgi:PEP-CTERM motif
MNIQKTILKFTSVASVVGFLSLSGPAQAALFNFSYTLNGGSVLSGTIDGTLQGDNNTVVVNNIINPLFNGTPALAINSVDSYFGYFNNSGESPIVSLDGSLMDLFACSANCRDAFIFDTTGFFAPSFYNSTPSYGDGYEGYVADRWSLTPQNVQSVPEPTSVFGLLGVGALGATLKRRKKEV